MTDDNPFDDLDVPEDPLEDLDRATQQLTVRTEERVAIGITENYPFTGARSLKTPHNPGLSVL